MKNAFSVLHILPSSKERRKFNDYNQCPICHSVIIKNEECPHCEGISHASMREFVNNECLINTLH